MYYDPNLTHYLEYSADLYFAALSSSTRFSNVIVEVWSARNEADTDWGSKRGILLAALLACCRKVATQDFTKLYIVLHMTKSSFS